MAVMKKAAADALADFFRQNLPADLKVKVEIGVAAAEYEEPAHLPSLRIIPQKFTFNPWQDLELESPWQNKALVEVGDFEGMLELRALACNRTEREKLEDAITDLFLRTEGAPGVIVALTKPVTVSGVATAYEAPCSYSLEASEWRDELAFSKQRYSFLDVDSWFPALVVRDGVYTIEDLIIAINHDLDSDVPFESVHVHQDGSLSPVV